MISPLAFQPERVICCPSPICVDLTIRNENLCHLQHRDKYNPIYLQPYWLDRVIILTIYID